MLRSLVLLALASAVSTAEYCAFEDRRIAPAIPDPPIDSSSPCSYLQGEETCCEAYQIENDPWLASNSNFNTLCDGTRREWCQEQAICSSDQRDFVKAQRAGSTTVASVEARSTARRQNTTQTTPTPPPDRPVYTYTVRVCEDFARIVWDRCDTEQIVIQDADGFPACVKAKEEASNAEEFLEDVLSTPSFKFVYDTDENNRKDGLCFNAASRSIVSGMFAAFVAVVISTLLL